ncbi:MAG TPA: AraC family transcriptional regulator [Cytophagales bacterium]|nr:AraC family transcriptional regulator [Cytophagales bacterium]
MTNTVSAGTINLILSFGENKGLDRKILCTHAGIDMDLLKDPDSRIPTSKIQALWKGLTELTDDESLPLKVGLEVNPFSLGVVVYMLMHCSTLKMALEKLCQYQDVACEGMITSFHTNNDNCFLTVKINDEAIIYPRFTLESELSVYLGIIKAMTGRDFPVKEVHFTYNAPSDLEIYRAVLGTDNICFSSSFTGLVFNKSLLDVPVLNANPTLFPLFEKHVKEYYDKLKHSDKLSFKIKEEIVKGLKGEEPTLTAIARNIGMSPRSIQMKLKEEQATFRQLLEEVRKDIAIGHLKENTISTTDISFLLGFSESSVFQRSFKKWTGKTPAAFRKVG